MPTYRFMQNMEKRGLKWLPAAPWHFDNNCHNYDFKEETEKIYQEALKEQEEEIKWHAEVDEGSDGPNPEPWWLELPVEEKLKAPDSDFTYDGLHKSLKPVIVCSGRNAKRELFNWSHKGNKYTKIRVPSLKRSKAEWVKFYNKFPWIAAEVCLGNRRFVNGAKLKYIW